MTRRIVPFLLMLALLGALTGCGGDTASPALQVANLRPAGLDLTLADQAVLAPQPAPQTPLQVPLEPVPAGLVPLNGWPAQRSVSSLPGLDPALLPPLPPQTGASAPRALKSSSALYSLALETPWNSGGGAVAAAGSLDLPSTAGSLCWAIYEQPLEIFEYPFQLGVQLTLDTQANGYQSGVWVGLSNYT